MLIRRETELSRAIIIYCEIGHEALSFGYGNGDGRTIDKSYHTSDNNFDQLQLKHNLYNHNGKNHQKQPITTPYHLISTNPSTLTLNTKITHI